MALPPELEARILHHYHVEKWRNSTIARHLGIHRSTVQHFLEQAGLPRIGTAAPSLIDAYWPFICQTLETFPTLATSRLFEMVRQRGYNGSNSHFRHVIANRRPRFDSFKWMLNLLQKKIKLDDLKHQLGDMPELEVLRKQLYNGRLFDRNKSMTILARQCGITVDKICGFLGISISTYKDYKLAFSKGGSQALFSRKPKIKKSDDEALKSEIFRVLHQPPSTYGINRTSWTMPLLRRILREKGKSACPEVIRSITWTAGYRWRKARVVLTSTDPTYSDKLQRIRSILSNLKSDEVFFSIDEYGPIAVKLYGGRKLVSSGERPVIPQWQKSRGSLIITAALELSTNQITHFYSKRKNTDEMVKMMNVLIAKYADRRKIYLSWDAASWHIAKQLNQRIDEHNSNVGGSGVVVETAPLPSGAQFLNVIESVFSGMSRAIIQNSNYPSLDDAKSAIDRHFEERNDYFQTHPHRAGKKIWGKEREPPSFSDSRNCKEVAELEDYRALLESPEYRWFAPIMMSVWGRRNTAQQTRPNARN